MGRRKIKIQPIEDERNKQVTFLKRKHGLMKKAYELSVLCNCEVAVMVFSSNGKLIQYSSKDMDQLLMKYTQYNGPHEAKNNTDFEDGGMTDLEPTELMNCDNSKIDASDQPPHYQHLTEAIVQRQTLELQQNTMENKVYNSDQQKISQGYFTPRQLRTSSMIPLTPSLDEETNQRPSSQSPSPTLTPPVIQQHDVQPPCDTNASFQPPTMPFNNNQRPTFYPCVPSQVPSPLWIPQQQQQRITACSYYNQSSPLSAALPSASSPSQLIHNLLPSPSSFYPEFYYSSINNSSSPVSSTHGIAFQWPMVTTNSIKRKSSLLSNETNKKIKVDSS
ncbi:hypothetical protein BC941DRAFT_456211 [Chlamydoabsidia padenii]|nr:hypothetical protein BC941DRAFT_456211 [Chlamydoabsidia padenii]